MDNQYTIGIIGVGVVAERIINAAMNHPHGKIKGIYDKDMDRMLEVTRKYGLYGYSSYEKMLDDKDIDIIYLAVPPKYHYYYGVDIFKSGKHFLCEKPLANSRKEVETMSKLAHYYEAVDAINFPTIYSSEYKRITELLEENAIGNVLRVEFHGYFREWPRPWQRNPWIVTREQGGFTREVVTHYIQLMQRLFGDIEGINSFINYPTDKYRSEKSIIAKANIGDIEVIINCIANIGMKENLSFNIIGSKGTISLKNWNELWLSKRNNPLELIETKESDSLVNMLDNLFKAIEGEPADLVDFTEGCKVHRVIEEMLWN